MSEIGFVEVFRYVTRISNQMGYHLTKAQRTKLAGYLLAQFEADVAEIERDEEAGLSIQEQTDRDLRAQGILGVLLPYRDDTGEDACHAVAIERQRSRDLGACLQRALQLAIAA
ncbi:hypothetical protein GS534_24330 [Rhodococcus hoagii]|nr:hypothetical protein [Prescottella equi]MBM4617943.1 hypothetical protein [Prescottella equi]NKS33158.1 hypothetical protein [Prescottella equi]